MQQMVANRPGPGATQAPAPVDLAVCHAMPRHAMPADRVETRVAIVPTENFSRIHLKIET